MPTLFPPNYPERDDAPLLSFGPSFSEEIARSVIGTIWKADDEEPHAFDIRVAAGLTMLEAFHPRDQLECMLAAQGVGYHCAIMETLRRAMLPDQPELVAIKLRASASQLGRTFSNLLRDMERRQTKPLPPRPGKPPEGTPDDPPPGDLSPGDLSPGDLSNEPPPPRRSRAKRPAGKAAAKAMPATTSDAPTTAEPAATSPAKPAAPGRASVERPHSVDDPELPEDIETRPDGTPGSLAGYLPKPPVVPYVPAEPAIMIALATRPKPWRMVNRPADPPGVDRTATQFPDPAPGFPKESATTATPPGRFDLKEGISTGDALARFASSRLDPNAPLEPLVFEGEDSVVELEMISTGGDPEAEAQRQAMMAAHPEGKPIVIFRHGAKPPLPDPAEDPPVERDENPPDT